MLNHCKSFSSNSVDGVIALFSIFHLPRAMQQSLFFEIRRILSNNSPILFTAFDSDNEGSEDNWLRGNKPMYWSNYPYEWYDTLLEKLHFDKIEIFNRKVLFDGNEENQYFFLFVKHDQ